MLDICQSNIQGLSENGLEKVAIKVGEKESINLSTNASGKDNTSMKYVSDLRPFDTGLSL